MFLTPHTSVALWLSTKISDPILAFILGFISHSVLDIIPHGDEQIGRDQKGEQKIRYILKICFFDFIFSVILLYFFIREHSYNQLVLFMAITGAWSQDAICVANKLLKLKTLESFVKIHDKIHHLLEWQLSSVYGLPLQIFVTLFMIKMIF